MVISKNSSVLGFNNSLGYYVHGINKKRGQYNDLLTSNVIKITPKYSWLDNEFAVLVFKSYINE